MAKTIKDGAETFKARVREFKEKNPDLYAKMLSEAYKTLYPKKKGL